MSEIKNVTICVKIVLLDQQTNKFLVCKRQGEEDYNGVYSLPGGKMDDGDGSIKECIIRELQEELGGDIEYELEEGKSYVAEFTRKDGRYMVLPHYVARYQSGDIVLSKEYSDYKWVNNTELREINHIENIPSIINYLLQ